MGRRRRGDRRSSRAYARPAGAPSHPRAVARRAECRYRGRPHRAREASRRVARPSSSQLRLLVQLLLPRRKNCLARTIFARASSKKTSPNVRPMPGTRRDGAGDALDKGASSSRWEASGPGFRALAESRRPHGCSELSTELSVVKRFRCLDREFGPHPGGRLFLLVSGWKAAFGKPPAPVEPFRATGKVERGCLLIESGLERPFSLARREITPRFRVHRRETGPRPSAWSSRFESKSRVKPLHFARRTLTA